MSWLINSHNLLNGNILNFPQFNITPHPTGGKMQSNLTPVTDALSKEYVYVDN